MKSLFVLTIVLSLLCVNFVEAAPTVAAIKHSEFQAVDTGGEHVYNETDMVVLEGILLHNPADMLDPTPDDTITETFNIGGQWQIFSRVTATTMRAQPSGSGSFIITCPGWHPMVDTPTRNLSPSRIV